MSQCTSCGGFCKKSGCERADYVPTECHKCKEWEAVCDQHLRHIKKLKKQRTWVGLTDEERINIIYKSGGNEIVAVQMAKAKLKEKNQ